MTVPLTPTVIVLGLNAADRNACTGTALPISLFHRECGPFQPGSLTQSPRTLSSADINRHPRPPANPAPTTTPPSLGHYPHSA